VDELMGDPEKRRRTLAIPATITETYGLVLGVSRLGLARFGEPHELDAIDSAGRNHRKDALLAVTARHENAVLVTDDRRLRNFASREGIEVWSSVRFIREGLGEPEL
jgi:predicted nucleic acid-binding protein